MENYQKALRIADRLANLDPDDADLQDDLSVSLENVGNILEIQGDHAGAIANYKASLAIRGRLAVLDPDQARWLRFLLTTHLALGNSGEDPKLHFTKALELAVELERTGRLEVGDSRLPELLRQKLEAL
jgi:tetratricopeptide (TPR) repeat protein